MMLIKKNIGLTLIELMVALIISSILIAALYRTFIGQQKTYTIQEQVVDTKQNLRIAMIKMMREIRMAGFGGLGSVLPTGVNGPTEVITTFPASNNSVTNDNSVTIVGAFKQVSTLAADADGGQNNLTLASATDAAQFDGATHSFISIDGMESNTVSSRAGAILTLTNPLKLTHKITDQAGNPRSVPIFKIQAITYSLGVSDGKPVLLRNENTGGGAQPVAENIEILQFGYFDANGNPTATSADIRRIQVKVRARTDISDPDYTGDPGGYRRREIISNIYVRNMGI